ncbi:MAG TPA: tyrosine-type recombinase/integrase, partial [Planctomicrobium sp.]|nr:tyrosine-type recombinase/integrase [Planctomicrobium sp.]
MSNSKLTLTGAFERHYRIEELRGSTVVAYQSALKLWERLTEQPDVRDIDNIMVDNFRSAALKEFAPYTVNRYWGACRSILRRIGPQETRNPWGLGIIDHIPAMRPCKVPFRRPPRLSMEDMDRIYLASCRMKLPTRNVPHPGFWWQAVVVMAYYTGLRLGDLLRVKWSDLNTQDATLFVKTGKTGVEADLPLPEVVLAHMDRLERRNERIFQIDQRKFTSYQAVLREHSGVDWTMHDIRRTACSEADRVRPGMGKVLLLHAPQNVTEQSYLNSFPELRETVEKMECPMSFRHGPKMAMRSLKEAKKVVNLRPRDFAVPTCPPAELFAFRDHG